MPPREQAFEGPWRVRELPGSFQVLDASGAVLGEVRFGSAQAPGPSKAEARRMAEAMAEAGDTLNQAAQNKTRS